MTDEIKIGDVVRSFDFNSRDLKGERACYVEGVVEGTTEIEGCTRYKIRVTKRIWAGLKTPIKGDGYCYPPLNGTPKLFGGVCDFVEKLT